MMIMENNYTVLSSYHENSNGGLQLPIGFRFRPTDKELILHYLKPKVHSLPLPASTIPELDDIFQSHPSQLPGDVKERKYFFCRRKWDYLRTSRSRINNISDGSGYWKEVGKEKSVSVVVAPKTSYVIGTKKSFVLYQGLKTSWFMNEYRLLPSRITTASTKDLQNWVAYRIYQRKTKAARVKITNKKIEEVIVQGSSGNNIIEFGSPPLPSPLCSSNEEEEEA